jgi:hypothetical protein
VIWQRKAGEPRGSGETTSRPTLGPNYPVVELAGELDEPDGMFGHTFAPDAPVVVDDGGGVVAATWRLACRRTS